MVKDQPKPSNWAKGEYRKRLAEAAIMFAWTLPVYNQESRQVFRLTFEKDIAIEIPSFFHDLTVHCIKYPERTRAMIQFIRDCCRYILEDTDKKPNLDLDDEKLEQLLNKWISGLPK